MFPWISLPPSPDYESFAKVVFGIYQGIDNDNKINNEWNVLWDYQREQWVKVAQYILDNYDKKVISYAQSPYMYSNNSGI